MWRRRVMLAAGKRSRLPREYQEVAYIESDGSQYIETNYMFTGGTAAIDLRWAPLEFSTDAITGWRYMFGTQLGTGSANAKRFLRLGTYGGYSGYNTFCGSGSNGGASIAQYKYKAVLGEWLHSEFSIDEAHKTMRGRIQESQDFTNTTYAGSALTETANPILSTSRSGHTLSARCKYSQIVDNGVLVRELISCRRKSDNKPGMYDLAGSICPLTNTPFYINAGTGEFLVGPDVN